MCNVDDRSAKSVMKLGDLSSHLNTELSIQVGQRLVHQEDLRVTDNSTAHSNTLSLTAGKSLRLSVKELVKVKDLSSFFDLLLDLFLRNLAKLKTECHVIKNCHMRIQSVVLEDHRDIAVLRLYIVHELAVDLELAACDILKTCDHTKCCGLSASGRTYENDEFLVSDFKVEILNCLKSVRVCFINVR